MGQKTKRSHAATKSKGATNNLINLDSVYSQHADAKTKLPTQQTEKLTTKLQSKENMSINVAVH